MGKYKIKQVRQGANDLAQQAQHLKDNGFSSASWKRTITLLESHYDLYKAFDANFDSSSVKNTDKGPAQKSFIESYKALYEILSQKKGPVYFIPYNQDALQKCTNHLNQIYINLNKKPSEDVLKQAAIFLPFYEPLYNECKEILKKNTKTEDNNPSTVSEIKLKNFQSYYLLTKESLDNYRNHLSKVKETTDEITQKTQAKNQEFLSHINIQNVNILIEGEEELNQELANLEEEQKKAQHADIERNLAELNESVENHFNIYAQLLSSEASPTIRSYVSKNLAELISYGAQLRSFRISYSEFSENYKELKSSALSSAEKDKQLANLMDKINQHKDEFQKLATELSEFQKKAQVSTNNQQTSNPDTQTMKVIESEQKRIQTSWKKATVSDPYSSIGTQPSTTKPNPSTAPQSSSPYSMPPEFKDIADTNPLISTPYARMPTSSKTTPEKITSPARPTPVDRAIYSNIPNTSQPAQETQTNQISAEEVALYEAISDKIDQCTNDSRSIDKDIKDCLAIIDEFNKRTDLDPNIISHLESLNSHLQTLNNSYTQLQTHYFNNTVTPLTDPNSDKSIAALQVINEQLSAFESALSSLKKGISPIVNAFTQLKNQTATIAQTSPNISDDNDETPLLRNNKKKPTSQAEQIPSTRTESEQEIESVLPPIKNEEDSILSEENDKFQHNTNVSEPPTPPSPPPIIEVKTFKIDPVAAAHGQERFKKEQEKLKKAEAEKGKAELNAIVHKEIKSRRQFIEDEEDDEQTSSKKQPEISPSPIQQGDPPPPPPPPVSKHTEKKLDATQAEEQRQLEEVREWENRIATQRKNREETSTAGTIGDATTQSGLQAKSDATKKQGSVNLSSTNPQTQLDTNPLVNPGRASTSDADKIETTESINTSNKPLVKKNVKFGAPTVTTKAETQKEQTQREINNLKNQQKVSTLTGMFEPNPKHPPSTEQREEPTEAKRDQERAERKENIKKRREALASQRKALALENILNNLEFCTPEQLKNIKEIATQALASNLNLFGQNLRAATPDNIGQGVHGVVTDSAYQNVSFTQSDIESIVAKIEQQQHSLLMQAITENLNNTPHSSDKLRTILSIANQATTSVPLPALGTFEGNLAKPLDQGGGDMNAVIERFPGVFLSPDEITALTPAIQNLLAIALTREQSPELPPPPPPPADSLKEVIINKLESCTSNQLKRINDIATQNMATAVSDPHKFIEDLRSATPDNIGQEVHQVVMNSAYDFAPFAQPDIESVVSAIRTILDDRRKNLREAIIDNLPNDLTQLNLIRDQANLALSAPLFQEGQFETAIQATNIDVIKNILNGPNHANLSLNKQDLRLIKQNVINKANSLTTTPPPPPSTSSTATNDFLEEIKKKLMDLSTPQLEHIKTTIKVSSTSSTPRNFEDVLRAEGMEQLVEKYPSTKLSPAEIAALAEPTQQALQNINRLHKEVEKNLGIIKDAAGRVKDKNAKIFLSKVHDLLLATASSHEMRLTHLNFLEEKIDEKITSLGSKLDLPPNLHLPPPKDAIKCVLANLGQQREMGLRSAFTEESKIEKIPAGKSHAEWLKAHLADSFGTSSVSGRLNSGPLNAPTEMIKSDEVRINRYAIPNRNDGVEFIEYINNSCAYSDVTHFPKHLQIEGIAEKWANTPSIQESVDAYLKNNPEAAAYINIYDNNNPPSVDPDKLKDLFKNMLQSLHENGKEINKENIRMALKSKGIRDTSKLSIFGGKADKLCDLLLADYQQNMTMKTPGGKWVACTDMLLLAGRQLKSYVEIHGPHTPIVIEKAPNSEYGRSIALWAAVAFDKEMGQDLKDHSGYHLERQAATLLSDDMKKEFLKVINQDSQLKELYQQCLAAKTVATIQRKMGR